MEYHKESNVLKTFMEHWGMSLPALSLFLVIGVVMSIVGLKGQEWISFLFVAFASLVIGAGMILYAKIPLYRNGQYFSFGVKSIPAERVAHYRWGWRVFLGGGILSLLLLLSRP